VGSAGVVKRYHKPGVTMCDIDFRKPPSMERVWRLARLLGLCPLLVRYDRTKHGWHWIVWWNRKLTPLQTIAIQCVLGSDRKRETFNLARVWGGKSRSKRWNLLFREKL